VWEEHFLYKLCRDGIYRRCLPEDEVRSVLHHYHASIYGGNFGPDKTIVKYTKQVSIGPRSLKMQENLLQTVVDVSEQGTFLRGMKWLKVAYSK